VQQSQAHLIASAAATKAAAAAKAAATVVAAAVAGRCVTSTPTPSSPSLLDQLSCTIPIEEGGVDKLAAPPTKAKKERKTSAKKTTASQAAAVPTSLAPPMMVQQPTAFAHGAMHSSAPFAHPLDYSSGGGSEPRSPMPIGRFNNSTGASAAAAAATSSGSFGFGVAEDNEPAAGDDEETRKGKLARKAELARLSRKRKKTRLTDLEAEVRRLEEELARAKRSKRDAELHSNQLSALAFQEAELAQADAVTKHKFTQVVAAMTEAVHSGVVARHEQEQLAAQAAHFSSLSAHSHSSAVHAASSGRPCLTGSDASNVSAKPTVLTPLIDAFMTHYGTQANNCMQHLSALDEHHAKPMRTFEFLQQIMQHNNDVSAHRHSHAHSHLFSFPTLKKQGLLDFDCSMHLHPGWLIVKEPRFSVFFSFLFSSLLVRAAPGSRLPLLIVWLSVFVCVFASFLVFLFVFVVVVAVRRVVLGRFVARGGRARLLPSEFVFATRVRRRHCSGTQQAARVVRQTCHAADQEPVAHQGHLLGSTVCKIH
jgi:hypothetical protein